VVYPAMEKYIKPNGHDMAEKDRQEHQEVNSVHGAFLIAKVKELLYQVQDMNVNKPEFDTLMEKLMKNLSEHIEEEEVRLCLRRFLSLLERRFARVGKGHRQK
jgi:hypothetical protein